MVRNGVRICIEDVTMHVSHERSNDTPFLRIDVNTIFTSAGLLPAVFHRVYFSCC